MIKYSEEMALIQKQRDRLFDILNRHVSAGDGLRKDRDFIVQVFRRWAENTNAHIGDPADGVILEKES